MTDEKNPKMMFQTIDSELLIKALSGEIDLNELAKIEVIARGLDKSGKPVSFKKSKSIWGVK